MSLTTQPVTSSAIVTSSSTTEPEFYSIADLSTLQAAQAVSKINGTLEGWENDTCLILRKYMNPEAGNYLLFEIAKIYGEAVGYAITRTEVDYFEGTSSAHLSFIAVKKEDQGKGIGSELLKRAIKKARELGYKEFNLDCEGGNLSFYKQFAKRSGLEYTIKDTGYYRSGETKHFVTYPL